MSGPVSRTRRSGLGIQRLAAIAWALLCACSGPPSALRDARADDAAATDASGDAGLPDLTADVDRAVIDLAIEQRQFAPDACELLPEENCVGAAGVRTLLRFSIETPNVGDGDLVLGSPLEDGNTNFQYSQCHGHYHFVGYAAYRLLDGVGGEVVTGHKQAFCLVDSERYVTDDPTVPETGRYSCAYQGIQRGWSDVYHSALACQFIDVTGVPDGEYTLDVTINENRTLPELRYDNNAIQIPVRLGDPTLSDPTEPCPDVRDRARDHEARECGWRDEGVIACSPGQTVRVGCSEACGAGSCSGDPVIRVCDAARADGNCSFAAALARADRGCGGTECPRTSNFACPGSGQLAVYTASQRVGEPYTCNLAVEEF